MKEPKIFSERNLTEKVHYVYRVTIDDKYYIGKRSGFLNDLITGRYKTSSKLVKEKLKNGVHFSKIKILQVFSTEKEALKFEERCLTRINAKTNPKFLNRTNGDKNFYNKQHTKETKEKMSKIQRNRWDKNTEEGRIRREYMSNKKKEYFNPETEEGRKNLENVSEKVKERFNPNTEQGRKLREHLSETQRNNWDKNTEKGRKLREHLSEKGIERFNPNTESGIKRRKNKSQSTISQFDINTEKGRKNRENHRNLTLKQFDINTEEGRKKRENHSEFMTKYYKTELGIKTKENHSEFMTKYFNPNTESGIKRRKNMSEKVKERFNPNTEQGRKNRKNHSEIKKEFYKTEQGIKTREIQSNKRKEKAKEHLQNRKNASILGELMFDEFFIRENFLIIDDKNNLRFLSSVYSKLSGYCESSICKEKRIGKLRFLYGIKSIIKISEEFENSKIEEIEAIIKSRK